jgi:ferredoxin
VSVLPTQWRFEASPQQSLLQAALQATVALPSSCRNGTCRACMCRLESGQIEYQIEWPGLSADEKREGLILPCVAQARSDLVLRLLSTS